MVAGLNMSLSVSADSSLAGPVWALGGKFLCYSLGWTAVISLLRAPLGAANRKRSIAKNPTSSTDLLSPPSGPRRPRLSLQRLEPDNLPGLPPLSHHNHLLLARCLPLREHLTIHTPLSPARRLLGPRLHSQRRGISLTHTTADMLALLLGR